MNNELLLAGVIGFGAARAWNYLKRMWLYRGEALPPHYHYRGRPKDYANAVPLYLWSYIWLCFNWYDPYLGEPRTLLKWL